MKTRYAEEYFYVGEVEIIKNPTHADYRALAKEFRKNFPKALKGEQYSRVAYDADGNKYIWRADFATHHMIEPHISQKFNTFILRRQVDPITKTIELF